MTALRWRAERVCIVLLTGLGDVVNGLPVATALKRDDPRRHVTWVAEPMPAALLRGHPAVDEIVVYHKKEGVAGVRRLARDLAGRRFDLALNLNVYTKSMWPTLLSRAPVRLGFDRARTFELTWLASNHRLPPRPRAHTADMFQEFLAHLGLPPSSDYGLVLTREETAAQAAFLAEHGPGPWAAVVPASANAKKDWLADRWAAVVDGLTERFGFRVLLAGGPGARERAIAREIEARAKHTPVWALGDGVRRLVWLLAAMDLVVAPDTGPVHVARALEVPVVGLYGHTNPWRVGPWRRFEELWVDAYTDPGEAPDPSRFDPRWERMERITPDDVLERVARAVERHPPRPA